MEQTKDPEETLLGAAGRLFRRRGFAATSLREVAAAAGMLPGSLHYRYATKDQLLVALMERGMRRALAEVRRAIGGEADPVARLRKAMRTHLDLLLSGDDAIYVLLYEWRSLRQEDLERVVRLRDEYDALWNGMLLEMAGAGRLREGADLQIVRLLFLGSLNWTAQWFSGDSTRTSRQIADAFLALIGIGVFGEESRPPDVRAFLAAHSVLDADIQALDPPSEEDGMPGQGGNR
jgi:AcrR family transcriptional regulator